MSTAPKAAKKKTKKKAVKRIPVKRKRTKVTLTTGESVTWKERQRRALVKSREVERLVASTPNIFSGDRIRRY